MPLNKRQIEKASGVGIYTPSTVERHVLPTELGGDRQVRIAFVSILYAVVFLIAWGVPTVLGTYTEPSVAAAKAGIPLEDFLMLWYRTPVNLIAGVASVLGALGFWLRARIAEMEESSVCGMGMLLLILGAFGIAAAEQWGMAFLPETGVFMGLSWVSFWILVMPLVVPTFPERALVGSLIAASMVPLVYAVNVATGMPPRPPVDLFFLFFPQYCCAVVAALSSRLIYQLGTDAARARKLGSYELSEQLGHGGMGEVWKAQHELLKRPAAVKVIRPERLRGMSGESPSTILRRFAREAKATAVLESPHTVTVYDYGVTRDGTFYYVMELLRGRDLETLVKANGPLPSERVAYLVQQVAMSLADAHANGLVHRDIKPANIYAARLGMEYDFAKVLDFGLVKAVAGASKQTRLTDDGIASGTPAYMAPEVASGDQDVGPAVDIYSLGCVAYWLLTGRLVFEADTAMQMVVKHVRDEPVPPSAISELPIHPELEEIVMSMLAKDPADRPSSAAELACRLSSIRFERPWDYKRARIWWNTHAPELAVSVDEPTARPTAIIEALPRMSA